MIRPSLYVSRHRSAALPWLLAAAVLATSCSDGTGPAKPDGVTAEGVVLRVVARQSSFSGSDTALVDVILENPRDTAITLTFETNCVILPYFLRPNGASLFSGFYSCGSPAVGPRVYAPGTADTVTLRLWSPVQYGNNTFVPLEAGRYTIYATVGPRAPDHAMTESNRVHVRYDP